MGGSQLLFRSRWTSYPVKKTFGGYGLFYLPSDVVLLADLFNAQKGMHVKMHTYKALLCHISRVEISYTELNAWRTVYSHVAYLLILQGALRMARRFSTQNHFQQPSTRRLVAHLPQDAGSKQRESPLFLSLSSPHLTCVSF